MTPLCVSNLTIIGSDNGSSPGRRQAIIWTNAGILLIEFNQNSNIFIQENALEYVVWEMASILSRPQKCQCCTKMISFSVWMRYFVWNFKDSLWNSTQNILPIYWKMCILFLYPGAHNEDVGEVYCFHSVRLSVHPPRMLCPLCGSLPISWIGISSRGIGIVFLEYLKTSNIRCTLVGNKILDHSDVVGASPVVAAPTTSSFST